MTAPPRMHGLTHRPGGSDPIPGLTTGGGGGTTTRKILVCWGGGVPPVTMNGLVWRVPYDSDGSSFEFTLARAFARVETPASSATSFRIEKSNGGDVGFVSTATVATLTVTGTSDYETETTGLAVAAASGNLLRVVYAAIGAAGSQFQVELVGSE